MKSSEIWHVLFVILILGFCVSVGSGFKNFSLYNLLLGLLFMAVIVLLSVLAKKMAAYYLESDVETKIWTFQRYWFREQSYFQKPLAIGIFLPLLVTFASLGSAYWLASTQSEVTAKQSRVVKRHGFYSYSEMTEFHIGLIAAAGIFASLVLGFVAYLLGLGLLGKLAVYFAFFNMLPLGNLDGTKVFFGSRILWFILGAITLIATGYAFWFQFV